MPREGFEEEHRPALGHRRRDGFQGEGRRRELPESSLRTHTALRRFTLLLAVSIAATAIQSPTLTAQDAWIAPKGEASLSIGYGNVYMREHYFGTVETDIGHSRSNSIALGLGYSLTDRLAIDLGLGYGYNKYWGDVPHPGSNLDNGDYHGSFGDYAINVRYQVLKDPLVLTPFVQAVIPSHGYTFRAHSAVGKDLHEYTVGLHVGRRLLSSAYVDGKYSYTFEEKVLNIPHDRSNVDLAVGYYLSPSVGVRVASAYQQGHGGLTIPDDLTTPELKAHHDQLSNDWYLNAGLGVAYALTGAVDVYAGYSRTFWGKNGHKVAPAITCGFSWSFSPKQLTRRYFPSRSSAQRVSDP